MSADENPMIVTSGVCRRSGSAHIARAHHRDYPEAWAEGESPSTAAAGLVDRLGRALDSASDRWRSEPVRTAIADVQAFIARVDDRA